MGRSLKILSGVSHSAADGAGATEPQWWGPPVNRWTGPGRERKSQGEEKKGEGECAPTKVKEPE